MASKLGQAVRLIEAGKEAQARRLLADVLQSDPTNDEAWVLMAAVAKTDEQRETCLREAFKLNSRNETALKALKSLKERQRFALAHTVRPAAPPALPIPRTKAPTGILKGIASTVGIVIVTAAILWIALFLQRDHLAGEFRWKEFSSEEGRFSILIPRIPIQTTETSETNVGEIDQHVFTTIHESITYVVSYSKYPQDLTTGNPQAVLTELRNSAITGFDGQLVSERSISLNGHPGRELEIKVSDDTSTIIARVRIFLVRNRLYYLYTITPEDLSPSPNIDKFMDSFRLLG
jgi:hypothetical protein